MDTASSEPVVADQWWSVAALFVALAVIIVAGWILAYVVG